eukprot:scaffold32739_cov18-Tisochrysis_lutea.AAC.1
MTAEMSVLMIQWEESDCSDIRCGYSNKKRGCAGINYIIGSVHKEQQRHAVLNGNVNESAVASGTDFWQPAGHAIEEKRQLMT